MKAQRASREQLEQRLNLRRSSAAQPHRNRRRELKRPGKGNRSAQRALAIANN